MRPPNLEAGKNPKGNEYDNDFDGDVWTKSETGRVRASSLPTYRVGKGFTPT